MHIPHDHPTLPGHFPGHPLVPAVVILDHVINAFEEQSGIELKAFNFSQIKFLVPIFPGDEFAIAFEEKRPGLIEFKVSSDKNVYTKGRFSFANDNQG